MACPNGVYVYKLVHACLYILWSLYLTIYHPYTITAKTLKKLKRSRISLSPAGCQN